MVSVEDVEPLQPLLQSSSVEEPAQAGDRGEVLAEVVVDPDEADRGGSSSSSLSDVTAATFPPSP